MQKPAYEMRISDLSSVVCSSDLGRIYHANYLRYMERARSDMLRLVGIDQYDNLESGPGFYAVSDLAICYKRPARLDDDLLVVSKIMEIRSANCRIHQKVMCGDQILKQGDVTVAYLSPGGRPMRQPKAWIDIRSEEHTSELQSLMRISYAVFCLKKKKKYNEEFTITKYT